jgi:hypothetical protein
MSTVLHNNDMCIFQATYRYTIYLPTAVPPLSGLLILHADEVTAHMSLNLIKDPETADITVDSIKDFK